jgi:hypothetical protein
MIGKDANMRFLRPLATAFALTALLATPLFAQTANEPATDDSPGIQSNIAFGMRSGYTSWGGVDQVHFGAHLKLGEVLPNVHFTPNVEAGVGGGATIIAINGDLAYSFTEFVTHPWNVYGGGSFALNFINPEVGESDTSIGLSALLGLERTFANEHQGLVEVRVGILDGPDFKLTFGYTLF